MSVEGFRASFMVAGHIMGASLVLDGNGRGKGGRKRRSILIFGRSRPLRSADRKGSGTAARLRLSDGRIDYGNRLHGEVHRKTQMAEIINEAAKRNAPILIRPLPSAARRKSLPDPRARGSQADTGAAGSGRFADGRPSDAGINRWNEEHDEEYASILAQKRHPLRTGSMTTASSRDESKRLNNMRGTRIIISASGMLTGGRVLHHAMRILPDENATIVFVGYQAGGTVGRRVLDGEPEVRIMKNWIPVRCNVEKVEGFSAHADWKGVIRWLEGLHSPPKRVFTTHGEPDAAEAMAQHIRDRFGWTVEVPTYGESFEL